MDEQDVEDDADAGAGAASASADVLAVSTVTVEQHLAVPAGSGRLSSLSPGYKEGDGEVAQAVEASG